MPKDETHCASFTVLLRALFSLNRLVLLTFVKVECYAWNQSQAYNVENFESRLNNFLFYRLQAMFVASNTD
jgi:hypothetical protein